MFLHCLPKRHLDLFSHVSHSISSKYSINRIDPSQEIARLRYSITLLEAHIFPGQRNQIARSAGRTDSSVIVPKKEAIDADVLDKSTAPGMLASQVQGGLYAGPTSAATHLIMVSSLQVPFTFMILKKKKKTARGP